MESQNMDCPSLCTRCCEFFGSVQNMNMCSKCYRDYMKEEVFAKPMVEPALVSPAAEKTPDAGAGDVSASDNCSEASTTTSAVTKNRCGSCNKKLNPVEMLGLKCRCGGVFCGKHRLAEYHSCSVNYKKNGKEVLAKQNPIIKADKLDSRV